jgi:hypothetical protein
VDLDGFSLPDSIEPTNALLEQFGVEWQVEEHEVVGELKVTSLATDL